jgi:23S rRNA (guanosine2251-2'-O)-methyltransferase
LLVLDGIEDPQNLGAVIRSAECAGVHGIIIPQHGSAKITPAVVRVAAGATEHMKVVVVEKISKTLSELSEQGIQIIGTDASAKTKYYNVPMREGVAIVFGSEGEGLKKSTVDACDILVSIPIRGKINSLNASVSAAVLMFEVVRQRTK